MVQDFIIVRFPCRVDLSAITMELRTSGSDFPRHQESLGTAERRVS